MIPFALHLNASDWQERVRIIGVMQLISYVMPNDNKMFDVVVAADLRSIEIEMLMLSEGVDMIPFSLHSNASDDVLWGWGADEKARDIGFEFELLSPEQLDPTGLGVEEAQY